MENFKQPLWHSNNVWVWPAKLVHVRRNTGNNEAHVM